LTVRSEREGVVHAVRLEGELDVATAEAVERELEVVEAGDAESIIIDLSGLAFIDSTGLRVLIRAQQRSRADSNRLALLRGPRSVQRVFDIAGLSDRLPFVD
jgi:anti-anti-sigma factor